MRSSITLGSLEKIVRSATPSRVKQLSNIFPSLPSAVQEMIRYKAVMGGSRTLGSLEKIVRSTTPSQVEQRGHIFPPHLLAVLEIIK